MKLFTPPQAQQKKTQEESLRILRIKELRDLESELRLKVAKTEAEFNETLVKNQTKWAEEFDEKNKYISSLTKEISELEEKRKKLLTPVSLLEDEAKKKLEEINKKQKEFFIKEEELESIKEKLENKLDEVGDREQSLIKSENEFTVKKEGLAFSLKSFEEKKQLFADTVNKITKELDERDKTIGIKETDIILKTRSLDAWENRLKIKEDNMRKEEIRLADQRATLERALKRGS